MNDNFEKWIQESAPRVEVSESSKDIHLAVLKHRLRERDEKYARKQARMRRGSVLVLALMMVFAGGNVSELGSDDLTSFIVEDGLNSETQTLKVGFRKTGITGPSSMNTETLLSLEREMEFSEGIPVRVESIGIQGNDIWSIEYEHEVNGAMEIGGKTVRDRPSNPTIDHLNFAISELDLVLAKIESGNLPLVSKKAESIDGYLFLLEEYHFQSAEFGLVIYKRGSPIR